MKRSLRYRKEPGSTGNKSVRVFTGFIWMIFTAIFICVVLYILTGEQFTIIRLISYLGPWLAGLLFIFVIVSALLRKRLMAVCMLVLATLISIPYIHLFIPSSTEPALGQQVYKVMTYSKMGRNHDIASVAKVVFNEKPDILFMQEINKQDSEKLIQRLTRIYNGSPLFYIAGKGLILSRYKVTSRQNKDDYPKSVVIDLPEMSILGWNVHLQKSITNTNIQYKMVNHLAEKISLVQAPVIVAGDFNATMINYPYIKMKQYLNNAFQQAGFGFGFTFPSSARRLGSITRFMRLDHIFYSNHFNVHDAYVVNESGGSDHYPVVAFLSLKQVDR